MFLRRHPRLVDEPVEVVARQGAPRDRPGQWPRPAAVPARARLRCMEPDRQGRRSDDGTRVGATGDQVLVDQILQRRGEQADGGDHRGQGQLQREQTVHLAKEACGGEERKKRGF